MAWPHRSDDVEQSIYRVALPLSTPAMAWPHRSNGLAKDNDAIVLIYPRIQRRGLIEASTSPNHQKMGSPSSTSERAWLHRSQTADDNYDYGNYTIHACKGRGLTEAHFGGRTISGALLIHACKGVASPNEYQYNSTTQSLPHLLVR